MWQHKASFDFFFGLVLGDLLLRHTDDLSRTLQNHQTSAAEGQAVASMTLKTHPSLRNDDHFKLIWTIIGMMAEEKGIVSPCFLEDEKLLGYMNQEMPQRVPHLSS